MLAVDEVLPDVPAGSGKGNALWMSLYACEGEIVCWLDADVRNFASHFVTRLVEPLLADPAIGFVKAYYRRPLLAEPTGGGRVTELMARPVISALFPHLARFVQPLAGEYAGRRELLETVPFVEGWGVEIGLLIDLTARFGSSALAQVDLDVREHRNRPLEELSTAGDGHPRHRAPSCRCAGRPATRGARALRRGAAAGACGGRDPGAAADHHDSRVSPEIRTQLSA